MLATYYVDAERGSDGNPGTAEAPFQTYLPFVAIYGHSNPDWGKVSLGPGDVVHFLPGRYTATFSLPEGNQYGFHLRGVHGEPQAPVIIRGQPGVVIDPQPADGSEFISLFVLQSSHVIVEGLEITGLGSGIWIADSQNVTIRDNWIHDIDGTDNDNIAGIVINNAINLDIHDNLIHDNYDRTNADTAGQKTENSRNAVFFASPGPIRFHHNTVFNSVPTDSQFTGAGFTVKHAADGSFEADHNVLRQVWGMSMGTSTARSSLHHNLILDSGPLFSADFGGAAYFNEIEFAHNTIISRTADAGGALVYNPTDCWYGYPTDAVPEGCDPALQAPIESFDDVGRVAFDANITYDSGAYNSERSTIQIGTYGHDRLYRKVIQEQRFEADRNVYYNPVNAVQFNLFNAQGGPFGVEGASYDFQGWQALGFDGAGVVANPQFDDTFQPGNAQVAGAGWYAGQGPRLTVLPVGSDLIAEGQATQAVVVRSGDGLDLNERLTVDLAATDPTEVSIPATLTFEPGETKAYFAIVGTRDGESDGTRATRIYAEAAGFQENVSAWIRVEDQEVPGSGFQGGVWTLEGTGDHRWSMQFDWLERLGEYDNELGVILADSNSGDVDGLAPGDPGYARAALQNDRRRVVFASGQGAGANAELLLSGGDHVVFYLVQNATSDDWLANNADNQTDALPLVFFSIEAANPDEVDHVVAEQVAASTWQFGWEDLLNGGDQSYRDAVVSVSVTPAEDVDTALVEYSLQAVGTDGTPLEQIHVGGEFFLEVRATDLRTGGRGVFSGYVDVVYDGQLAVPAGPLQILSPFNSAQSGDLETLGEINEAGGIADVPFGDQPAPLLRLAMRAVSPGRLSISGNPADELPLHETTLHGLDSAVETTRLRFGELTIEVVQSWHNAAFPEDVNLDQTVSPVDAVIVINALNRYGALPLPLPAEVAAGIVGMPNVNADEAITPLDALIVINYLNRLNGGGGEGEGEPTAALPVPMLPVRRLEKQPDPRALDVVTKATWERSDDVLLFAPKLSRDRNPAHRTEPFGAALTAATDSAGKAGEADDLRSDLDWETRVDQVHAEPGE